MIFLFKQKTAYEMRISDWSSDVCSSDLQFLDAAGHAQAAVGIDLAAVAGMEEAVVRGVLGGLLRHLEIAEHLPRTFHENLAAVADPAFDARHRLADVTDFHVARRADMRSRTVLGHAEHFEQFEDELAVPGDDVRRERRGAGHRHARLVEPPFGQDLALSYPRQPRDREHQPLFSCWQLCGFLLIALC